MFDPKGMVIIKKEFVATKVWPGEMMTSKGWTDMEQVYKDALAGKPARVMDIAVDDSGYLVIGESELTGPFLWMIEKEDTVGFLPIKNKNGVIMRTDLSPMEEIVHSMASVMEDMGIKNIDTDLISEIFNKIPKN